MTLPAAAITFFAAFIVMPILIRITRLLLPYTIVQEGTCQVFVLFGKVIGTIKEPGFHMLWPRFGTQGLLVSFLGRAHVVDMRLDQVYLRSQPVNSEEGAPMGIGMWYEMFVTNPVDFLFKNTNPRGSLAANVSNATVRCLSNMELDHMLTNRHKMSRTVRDEVSPMSHEWGYKLGSVYIRKVHFRDLEMINQIEEKVVNRLRQVTSAIRQGGANRVDVITSSAERRAAAEFARAAAQRPKIVGAALAKIGADPEISKAVFDVLEVQALLEGKAKLSLIPEGSAVLGELLAARESKR